MADQAHAEHKHGSMDIREHQKTFNAFVKFTAWVVGISFVVLIFLALANA